MLFIIKFYYLTYIIQFNNKQMILTIAIAVTLLILVLCAYGYYTIFIKTKKTMDWYKNTLEAMGYNVQWYQFKPLGSGAIERMHKEEKQHGDKYYSLKKNASKIDVGLFNVLGITVIEFYSPQLIQEFCRPDNPYIYHKFQFMISNIRRSLGHGIAFSQGNQWKKKRKIMNSVFNYDFLKQNIPKIIRLCNEDFDRVQMDYFQKNPQSSKDKMEMDVLQLFSSIYSNVMMECFFGVNSIYEKINGQLVATFLSKLNNDITLQGYSLPGLLLGSKFLNLGLREQDRSINNRIKILRALAKQKIDLRLGQIKKQGAKQKYTDIIEALVVNKKIELNSHSDQGNYDYRELIQQFCTFYTAGTDTTSHFTQMMVYYLFLNPEIEKKARQIVSKYITSDEDITTQNLKRLQYIDWIQNQTTRMYGPGTGIFIRKAQKDHYIRNIPIHEGVGVSIQPLVAHFNEKYYKNPSQFRPERWESQCDQNHPYAFGGFSGGPRSCLGKHLALLESKIGLVKFFLRYKSFKLPKTDFKMLFKFLSEPQPMDLTVEFTGSPKLPVPSSSN